MCRIASVPFAKSRQNRRAVVYPSAALIGRLAGRPGRRCATPSHPLEADTMHSPFDNDFELPGPDARPATAPNREIYTVGRLNDEVAQVLENSFAHLGGG